MAQTSPTTLDEDGSFKVEAGSDNSFILTMNIDGKNRPVSFDVTSDGKLMINQEKNPEWAYHDNLGALHHAFRVLPEE